MRRTPRPDSERLRVPQPLIRYRIPSGRGATEQPNAAGDGDAVLSVRFWAVLLLTGAVTGLMGDALMWLLFTVEHIAFGFNSGRFETAAIHASGGRRVASLALAGVIGGVAWYLLRRATPGESSEVDDALWAGHAKLSFRRCLGTSVISEVVIGMGASLGREAAPKLMGGAAGSVLAQRAALSAPQRRLLVACGAGAGFAAVYNVPLGGALFTAEILLGTISLPVVLPAAACSGVAAAVAWLYLPDRATYLGIPNYHLSASLVVWSLLLGPIVGLVATGYIRLVAWVSHHRATGRLALIAPLVAFTVLGVIGIRYPQLFGNGRGMAQDAFVGTGSLALLAALFVLKPLVTSLCLGSGASGGLFTPVLSTGAVLGGALGLAWTHLWPGAPLGAFALIGAAAMIGAGMQAPLAALVLVLELTRSGYSLVVPMLAATVLATAVSRQLDGYSIYSARLTSGDRPPEAA